MPSSSPDRAVLFRRQSCAVVFCEGVTLPRASPSRLLPLATWWEFGRGLLGGKRQHKVVLGHHYTWLCFHKAVCGSHSFTWQKPLRGGGQDGLKTLVRVEPIVRIGETPGRELRAELEFGPQEKEKLASHHLTGLAVFQSAENEEEICLSRRKTALVSTLQQTNSNRSSFGRKRMRSLKVEGSPGG